MYQNRFTSGSKADIGSVSVPGLLWVYFQFLLINYSTKLDS